MPSLRAMNRAAFDLRDQADRLKKAMITTSKKCFRLIMCDRNGRPVEPIADVSPTLEESCRSSASLYAEVGYVAPWVSYVAICGPTAVGMGAFLGPPADGCVEIAYFTLEEHRGQGFAMQTARALCRIARVNDDSIRIVAKTRPEQGASTRILAQLGFGRSGEALDHEIGTAWLWELS